jgi:hypothetical protein
MYVSIVCTALILHYSFALVGVTPESARAVKYVAQFKLDYTFWMNLVALGLVGWLSWLNHTWHLENQAEAMDIAGGGRIKKTVAAAALAILVVGIMVNLFLTWG